jgi:hypothetical protein
VVDLEIPAMDQWIDSPIRAAGAPNATNGFLSIVQTPLYRGSARDADGGVIDVMYLKLTLDPARRAAYTPETMTEFNNTKSCGKKIQKNCNFPHTPTIQTAYRPEQFRAHRDLGAALVRLHLAPALREYSLKRTSGLSKKPPNQDASDAAALGDR